MRKRLASYGNNSSSGGLQQQRQSAVTMTQYQQGHPTTSVVVSQSSSAFHHHHRAPPPSVSAALSWNDLTRHWSMHLFFFFESLNLDLTNKHAQFSFECFIHLYSTCSAAAAANLMLMRNVSLSQSLAIKHSVVYSSLILKLCSDLASSS